MALKGIQVSGPVETAPRAVKARAPDMAPEQVLDLCPILHIPKDLEVKWSPKAGF